MRFYNGMIEAFNCQFGNSTGTEYDFEIKANDIFDLFDKLKIYILENDIKLELISSINFEDVTDEISMDEIGEDESLSGLPYVDRVFKYVDGEYIEQK